MRRGKKERKRGKKRREKRMGEKNQAAWYEMYGRKPERVVRVVLAAEREGKGS